MQKSAFSWEKTFEFLEIYGVLVNGGVCPVQTFADKGGHFS